MNFESREAMIEWLKPQVVVTDEQRRIVHPGSGKLGRWLVNSRELFLSHDGLRFMADRFWAMFADREVLQIAAPETAGIPLLPAIILSTPPGRLPPTGVMVRKERKRSGLGNRLEGPLRPVSTVLLDDLVNSGSSSERAIVALEAEGATVSDMFCLCDFESRLGMEWRERRQIPVHSVVTLRDLGLKRDDEIFERARTFDVVWHHAYGTGDPWAQNPKSKPVYDGLHVYSGTDTGEMRAIDPATGRLVWKFECPAAVRRKGIFSIAAVHGEQLHFGAYDGSAYCLDRRTGALIWRNSVCDWIGASPQVVERHGLVLHGLEFAPARAKGAIAALRLSDGEMVWQIGNSRLQHGSGAYSAKRDRVFWGTADYDLLCMRPEDGSVLWSFRTKRSIKYSPAVDDDLGLVAVGSFDNHVYVVDADTGEERARYKTDDIIYNTPLFHEGRLYFSSGDKRVYMANMATMELEATYHAGGRMFASPTLHDGLVFVAGTDGLLLGLDPLTLKRKVVWAAPDSITNAPAIVDGDLVVSTVRNDLFRLRSSKATIGV